MQHQKPTAPPTSVFCAAAPSDAALLAQWETHLLPLQQARQITVWSERHLIAGAPRTQQIHEHLDQAQMILFLLSADFFASNECMALMERALASKARVIPLIVRPAAWQQSPLASLRRLPPNALPVTSWDNPEEAFHACYQELLLILSQGQSTPSVGAEHIPVQPKLARASALQNQNRERMLRRLRRAYSDLMSQSLQGAAWLELGLAEKPDAVQNATNLLLRMPNRAEQRLPPGTSIIQAYDEAEHELLILGEPGAGKSTLLLDLAQQLVGRAEQDETHPLPVILPLSSWAVKRPPLQDWIAEQLAEIYDVPRTLSTQWVQEGSILPLLDGLDEMEEAAHSACITAINAYHRDHLAVLVVCSRTAEYEAATERHRLALQGAVVVQPLTHEDIDAYLVRAGKPLSALRSALKKNTALHDLATTPLMLNILILTYQGTSVRGLSNREPLLLQQVWDDYVRRMAERKGNSKRYPLKQTRSLLGWLARQIREHNQTIFYLEHLQPDWLTSGQQQAYTWLAIRLPAIMIGVLISILVSLFLLGDSNPSSLIQNGVLGGLLGEIWYRSKSEKGSQGEPWGKCLLKRLTISACIGLIYGLGFGFKVGPYYTLSQWQTDGLSYGIGIGLDSLLLQYLLTTPFRSGHSPRNAANRRWKRIARFFQAVQGPRVLLVAAIVWLSAELGTWLWRGGPSYSLSIWANIGLTYGLTTLTLNTQIGDIHPTERLRWTPRSLSRALFRSRHLHITALVISISMIFVGLTNGPSTGLLERLSIGLSVGLSAGLSYWLLLGLFQGIAQERIEDQDRHIANEGIRRSFRNSVIMGITGGGIIGSIGALSLGLSNGLITALSVSMTGGLNHALSDGLFTGLQVERYVGLELGISLGISGALLVCIFTGGLAVWRHYMIRFLLTRSHTFPWQALHFLDDATARLLLRRIDGGYSFTHRLLLDYFGDMETGNTFPDINIFNPLFILTLSK